MHEFCGICKTLRIVSVHAYVPLAPTTSPNEFSQKILPGSYPVKNCQTNSHRSSARQSVDLSFPSASNQGRKKHDSHRRDRIRRDFLHWIFRYFLQILGASSYYIAHNYWRKSKKSSGEPPVETAPRNCRFLSLVVVERALK